MARSDIEPFFGLTTCTIRSFTSAGGCPSLLRGNFLTSPGLSQGVLVSELRARAKRLSSPAQSCCQALGGLPGMTCGALGFAVALGGLTLGRGAVSAISRFLAHLLLLEPALSHSLSLRPLPLSGLLMLLSQTLTLIRELLTLVGCALSFIRDPLSLIRDPVTLIRGLLAPICHPLALVGHPSGHRWLSLLRISLGAQPVTLTLQNLIIGREPRRAALNLRADTLGLGPRSLILVQRAGAQLPQIAPVRIELGQFTL